MPDWIETAKDDEGEYEDGTVQHPINTWIEAVAIAERYNHLFDYITIRWQLPSGTWVTSSRRALMRG